MDKKWYYDAFISYRHMELDGFVAKNLHRQLESFKLPGNLARRLKEKEEETKTRITRVFRDQEELPLVSNLADPIMEALEKSEFLIVICSPRLKESMWCKKEIETFIGLRGREHVLLVLIEGEPEDSFPEELLYREIEEIQTDGSVIKKTVPAEPLAADVRGSSLSEIKKKIKSEVIRLAAPMFQCGYDDLKQRHREQKMRKIITASLAGSAVCLLFGLVSTTMALQIRRQNEQITKQSEEIATQAEEIEKQYAQALRNSCISQAKEAENLLEQGDRIGAIETAMQVFPGGGNEDIPYTAQAAYVLSESLNLYENGTQILPDRILEADTIIDFITVSPEGSRILSVDDFGMLCVWDGKSGERLASFLLEKTLYRDEDEIAFLDEDTFLYLSETGVHCYDIRTGEITYKVGCEDVFGLSYCKDNDRAVVSTRQGFVVIQGQNGGITAAGGLPEEQSAEESALTIETGAVMNEDGTLFAIAASSEEKNLVLVYETETGELCHQYAVINSDIDYLRFVENVLYVIDSEEFDTSDIWAKNLGGNLYACDLSQDNTFLWTYTSDTNWLYEVSVSSAEGSRYLLCSSYDSAVVLDKENGSYIDSFFFGSEIVKLGKYLGRDAFLVFTRDGTWHYVNLDIMTDLVGTTFSHCTSANVKMFEIGDDYYATLPYQSKRITLYRSAVGSNFETLCETENRYAQAALSEDGTYLAVSSYVDGYTSYIEMIRTDTGEVLWHYEGDNYSQGMGFYPEKKTFVLATGDGIFLFDEETGKQIAFYDREELSGTYLGMDATGRYVFYRRGKLLYHYDLSDGSVTSGAEWEEIFADGNVVSFSPSMEYFAAASKASNSLQLYYLDALQEGKAVCLDEVENINATYVEYLFFDDRKTSQVEEEENMGQMLYVVYKNGDVTAYPISSSDLGPGFDEENSIQYQDMEDKIQCFLQPEGADYGLLVGINGAYLSYNMEITSHIKGFLAVDGTKNCIYLTDGTSIYQAPVYDVEALREEAERQIENSHAVENSF